MIVCTQVLPDCEYDFYQNSNACYLSRARLDEMFSSDQPIEKLVSFGPEEPPDTALCKPPRQPLETDIRTVEMAQVQGPAVHVWIQQLESTGDLQGGESPREFKSVPECLRTQCHIARRLRPLNRLNDASMQINEHCDPEIDDMKIDRSGHPEYDFRESGPDILDKLPPQVDELVQGTRRMGCIRTIRELHEIHPIAVHGVFSQ